MKSDTIKDYFLIGDLHSAALVSKHASIDWLCLPRFDSPSIFGKLLDPHGGHFAVRPTGYTVNTHYVKDTAIVESVFEKKDASFLLHDFMVPQPTIEKPSHFLVRKFKGIKGTSHVTLSFSPQANYAREDFSESKKLLKSIPDIPKEHALDIAVVLLAEKETLILSIPKTAHIIEHEGNYTIHLVIPEGDTQSIVLEYASQMNYETFKGREFESETIDFWKAWISKGTFFDFCREQLVRSAITLKLMQFYETGALIASPTTSLPEAIGGVRNWDYRYVWIRDATFTLYAFYVLGYIEEAERFFDFIHGILKESKKEAFDISLFYTITGRPVPNEKLLGHFQGYKGSKPVRIGNGANEQFQLDVYGALIDAHYFIAKRKRKLHKINKELIMNLVYKIEALWQTKDNGIWEVRFGRQHFTYSKVMAWVGVDRTLRLAKQLQLTDKEKRLCKKLADEIKEWTWKHCYSKEKETFLQSPDTPLQDATNFLFVLLQFLDKHDPKTKKILEKTREELVVKDFFVYRYLLDDGIPGSEGAFLLCTFWYISSLAITGETERAEALFYELRSKMPENALLAEEMNPQTDEYLGNYPQAFSHLGFILSAYYIERYRKKKKPIKK